MAGERIGVAVLGSASLGLTVSKITALIWQVRGKLNWIQCRKGVCPCLGRAVFQAGFYLLAPDGSCCVKSIIPIIWEFHKTAVHEKLGSAFQS